MSRFIYIFSVLTLLIGCYRFELTNTAYPEEGTIVLDVVLPEIESDEDTPTTFIVEIDGQKYTIGEDLSLIPHLFEPGEYTMFVYNESNDVSFEDGIATLALEDGYVLSNPDATYFGMQSVVVTADNVLLDAITLESIDGEVDINFMITSGDSDNVASSRASLSGITYQWDCINSVSYGDAETMLPVMTQGVITKSGANDSIYSTIRMLGTNGDKQYLTLTLTYVDGSEHSATYDVSEFLAGFNGDKGASLTISANIAVPTDIEDGEFTIDDWHVGDSIVDGEVLAPES